MISRELSKRSTMPPYRFTLLSKREDHFEKLHDFQIQPSSTDLFTVVTLRYDRVAVFFHPKGHMGNDTRWKLRYLVPDFVVTVYCAVNYFMGWPLPTVFYDPRIMRVIPRVKWDFFVTLCTPFIFYRPICTCNFMAYCFVSKWRGGGQK